MKKILLILLITILSIGSIGTYKYGQILRAEKRYYTKMSPQLQSYRILNRGFDIRKLEFYTNIEIIFNLGFRVYGRITPTDIYTLYRK